MYVLSRSRAPVKRVEQITLVQGLSLFFFDSIFGSVEGVTHLFSAVFLFAL